MKIHYLLLILLVFLSNCTITPIYRYTIKVTYMNGRDSIIYYSDCLCGEFFLGKDGKLRYTHNYTIIADSIKTFTPTGGIGTGSNEYSLRMDKLF